MSKNNVGKNVLVGLLTPVIGLFFRSWILMLLFGALLGNQGLWTPAYWEVFGGLYTLGILVGYATSIYWDAIKVLTRKDLLAATKATKELI